jgi:hypothetical protein
LHTNSAALAEGVKFDVFLLVIFSLIIAMEVDEKPQDAGDTTAQTLRLLNASLLRKEDDPAPDPGRAISSTTATDPHSLRPSNNSVVKNSLLIQQCSNAKKAGLSVTVHDCSASDTGPVLVTGTAPLPRLGKIIDSENYDHEKTYNGARLMRTGIKVNEVMTCSFDPKTLNCLACTAPHSILGTGNPIAICFADQNFVPYICGNTGCIAVVRLEDASLADLTAIATEMLGKSAIPPGSVILLGSASHLFKVGVGMYAADWVAEVHKLELRFKNVNFCPLAPILRELSPGSIVQDLETLSVWLHMMYDNSIKGLMTCWDAVVHFAQISATGPTTAPHEVLLKLPLPLSLRIGNIGSAMIRICSSCPALLPGMSCTVTKEVVNILLTALQNDFTISVGPEVSLQRASDTSEDLNLTKHLVCIGSSILNQLIPHFRAAGYTITDLTQPGWIASDDNIATLIKKMSDLKLEPGFAVVMDLVSNCSYRYTQFDGTQALPYKEGGKYHYAGPVTLCGEDTFKKILKMLGPVLLSAQNAKKIVIPPLPRHVFSTCCSATSHCANFSDEKYAEGILNGATKLRGVMKKECGQIGMRNQWVLDGIGAITGTPAGQSYGTNREILPELKPYLAKDGVHLNDMGSRNIATSIIDVLSKMGSGKLKGEGADTGSGSGTKNSLGFSDGRSKCEYFWRGFNSCVGDTVGRAKLAASGSRQFSERPGPEGPSGRQGPNKGGRQYHPYGSNKK